MTARLRSFLPHANQRDLERSVRRLLEIEDVVSLALMPDAHVASEVCVGAVTATSNTLLPAAVGSDIGCGMVTLRVGADSGAIDDDTAARILDGWYRTIPALAHPSAQAPALPEEIGGLTLSPDLEGLKRREARLELGTLGRGNHFIELQADEQDSLWLLIHSGSRAIGPAIRRHHERSAARSPHSLAMLPADNEMGRQYLSDCSFAARYAIENRRRMEALACEVLSSVLGAEPDPSTRIEVDHNHVRHERHEGRELWVHRKGAMGLNKGALGVVPGSMGTFTFHVEGRGCEAALGSSAHGAGRAMSRHEARRTLSIKHLLRDTKGVYFDERLKDVLCEEAPAAYKDIVAVMRAQRDLVRIRRKLRPCIVYKAP